MGQPVSTATVDSPELGVRDILLMFWRERVLVVGITVACVVAGAAGGIMNTKVYKATVQFAVSSGQTAGIGGNLGALVSQFGSLGSLAGVALGGGGRQEAEPLAVLQSRVLTQAYIEKNELLPILYPDQWDPVSKKWMVADPDRLPTVWKAYEDFRKIRTVLADSKTGLYTLTITWKDPELAARWANDLVREANNYLRARALAESERNVEYLRGEAAKTDIVQVKTAMYGLIENEVKQAMLARGRDDFALKVIDPAVVPERTSSPRMLVWLLAGGVLGAVLAAITVFVRAAWRNAPASA